MRRVALPGRTAERAPVGRGDRVPLRSNERVGRAYEVSRGVDGRGFGPEGLGAGAGAGDGCMMDWLVIRANGKPGFLPTLASE